MISWRELQKRIPDLTEVDIWHLLEEELQGAARASMIERLHRRYCALRASRERIELMSKARRG